MGDSDSSIVIMILFVAIIGIITCINTAIQTMSESNVRRRALEGDKRAILFLEFVEKPSRYRNIFELLSYGSAIMIGFMYGRILYNQLKQMTELLYTGSHVELIRAILILLIFVGLVLLVTLFGRVFPKKIGFKYSESIAFGSLGFLQLIVTLFRPFSMLLGAGTKLLLLLFRINPKDLEDNVTEEEIRSIVNEGQEQGIIEANEAEMISNIMELDTIVVEDIMTHRMKIVAIDANLSIEEAIRFMSQERYSRFPLYEDDIDNIIGIIHLKDATRHYVSDGDSVKSLCDIAREPYFVPDTQRIDVLFNDMQLKKIHMAVAIDEYGQTAGLVAMEDILEEIVGNILDEYDEEEKFIVDQGKGKYLIKGLADLEEIEEKLSIEFEQDEYDTLNGFLISKLNRIPSDGEKTTIAYKGYLFQIMYVKDKMIRYVKVYPDENEK